MALTAIAIQHKVKVLENALETSKNNDDYENCSV